jgi:hypothetical protein
METILNGNKLSKKTLLQDQDKITIGSYHLFCRTLDSEAPLLKPQNAPEKNTTLPLRDFQDAHDLMGSFDHLRLTELLSTLEHHKKSGNLNIIHQEEEGKLYFHKGKLLRCSYQNLENFDAIFTLLRLEDGVFEFSPEDLSEESDEMQMPVSQILIRFIQGR